jgi:hypothetical protein
MTPEKQRVAIAEACGWKWERLWTGELHGKPVGEQGPFRELPDYLNDLNAMHEAEESLHGNQYVEYTNLLIEIEGSLFGIRATAAERAEAFLKTLNLWIKS